MNKALTFTAIDAVAYLWLGQLPTRYTLSQIAAASSTPSNARNDERALEPSRSKAQTR